MAIPNVAYERLPFAAPRYTPDTSRLGSIYAQGGDTLARLDMARGNATAEGLARLAAIISGGIDTSRAMKARKEEQAIRANELEAARQEREAEREAVLKRETDREAAAKAEKDAEREYRERKDTATAFGNAVAASAATSRLNALQKFAEQFGGTVGANGQVVFPPRAEKPPTPTAASLALEAAQGDPKKALEILSAQRRQNDTNPALGDIPGDWDKSGADFLATIPKNWQKTVEKIAKYDEDPVKAVGMRGGNRELLMRWVNQVNPEYDASQFSLRAPTRKAFTIGTQGQQINAINTAMGHIDQMTELADALQNGGFVPGNQAFNAVKKMFGQNAVTNFDTLKDALAGEVASVLSKSGATVSGIQDAKTHISSANSPKQLAGYVKTLIPVLGSKLASFDYQYKQAMGASDPFSPLSAESKRILEKHGFDPEHPTITSGDATAPAVKVLSITPVKKP